ncbi:LPS export ABC transporter periplasmic protein LptC [Bombella sp. TMW 2.2543]|uniref:LPS export ABC transporter periplasmic protein LptC n=1 Tax=Bombella pluederhausensis TaxID=2967336 RepID=A0ABT3WHX9_9PROT|nr:LPS export ABC transporter periplasmic protein LptC [Bombella pluederhausensis]MCX5617417.1 LPS export ABC transporter periplasmic protein LptC [Bombella pluederhausensis]
MNGSQPKRDDFDSDRLEKTRQLDAMRQEAMSRRRTPPSAEAMARRRRLLKRAKWALPGFAALLLVSVAAWPEINHLIHQNSAILAIMRRAHTDSGMMEHAAYHDIDAHDRPYTITARIAQQNEHNRIDMIEPEADIMLHNHQWVHARADNGMYLQHEQTLTLNGHVVIYRSDGVLLNSPSADIDLPQQVIATHDWVHAEGPFGTQDAEGAFMDQQTNTLQFVGAGRTNHFEDLSPSPSSPTAPKSP